MLPNITIKCNFTLFSDNTNLTFQETEITSSLVLICDWLCSDKVVITIDKTQFIVFHRTIVKHKLNIKIINIVIKQ